MWISRFLCNWWGFVCSGRTMVSSLFLLSSRGLCALVLSALLYFLVTNSSVMTVKSYRYHTETLVKDYLFTDGFIPYVSIIAGIVLCKMIYDLSELMSSNYFKAYAALGKIQRLEWNNRGMSSAHAIFITIISGYFVFFSNLYSYDQVKDPISFRTSSLSTLVLGVSVGYFIADLAMIYWFFPSLGGMEYVLHHFLSIISIAYTMLTGEGHLYTHIVLISEATTPAINLRWFLDVSGMKRSQAYIINGVVIFAGWTVARLLLFVYYFTCVYLYYHQIQKMHTFGHLLVLVVPSVLSIMNAMWFVKILNGLKKTLAKKQ